MSAPSHIACVVTEPKEGTERKVIWREVGVVWQHRNGNGFALVIRDQLAVSGRILCTQRREKTNDKKGG